MITREEILNGMSEIEFAIKTQGDILFFIERMSGDKFSNFHREQLNIIHNNKYSCIMSPRGHLKTTLFSIWYPIWLLYTRGKIEICIVSGSREQSLKFLDKLRHIIEDNEILKELKPAGREDTWNKGEIYTTRGGNIYIRPYSDSARGMHPDVLILDDVLRDSDISHDEIIELFNGVFMPMSQMKKWHKKIVVGTAMTTTDLLHELEGKKGWSWKKYQACDLDKEGNLIKPLWKEVFSIDALKSLRDTMGALKFDREYLNNPLAGGDMIFPTEIIKRQIWSDTPINVRRELCQYYFGMDMAISTGARADFTVFTVIEKDIDGVCRLVKLERYKTDKTDWMLQRIKELDTIFKFNKIKIEDRGLSKGFVDMCERDPQIKFRVEGFVTSQVGKEELISSLQAAFMRGDLFILNNPILLAELASFAKKKARDGKETLEGLGRHDDTVISLALAWSAAAISSGVASLAIVDF